MGSWCNSRWDGVIMILFAKALLAHRLITDVLAFRNNYILIDNEKKEITVYRVVSANNAVYNVDILPVVAPGYEAVRLTGSATHTSGGITYWRYSPGGGVINRYEFKIIRSSTGEVVAEYTFILNMVTQITDVQIHPTDRISLDSVSEDFTEIYLSNINTDIGYLRFFLDLNHFVADIRVAKNGVSFTGINTTKGYSSITFDPTKFTVGETTAVELCIKDRRKNSAHNQRITVHYTRTI